MACKINLTPSGGDANGSWFLTSAPVGFDGTLSISCDNVTYVPINSLPSDTIPLDNSCGDKSDIWVDLSTEEAGTYVFTYVTPAPNNASDCGSDCIDCSTFTITAEALEPDTLDTYCSSDGATYNVFTALSLNPLDWTIDSITGCILGDPDCVAVNGDFIPSAMGPGTYVVTLTRNNALAGCDDCDVQYTIQIDTAGSAGDNQSGIVCV